MRKATWFVALAGTAFAAPALAALCTNDPVPAASLLVPYFEVGACNRPTGLGTDTRFSLTNTGAAPRLAHVTLWTNTAVPAFDFDVYLNGYAQETISLRELFCNGTLPQTGTGPGQRGRLASAEVNFTGCNTGVTPGASPVYAPLAAATRAELEALFSGQPVGGQCSALPETLPDDSRFTGYVTVDSVDRCNAPVGGEAGFDAALRDENVLAGRVTLEDSAENLSFGYAAVALEAATGGQLAGSRTFHDFDAGGTHPREPLATTWGVDFSPVTGDRTSLVIWRGTGQVGTPFACSAKPPWYPLDFSNLTGFSTRSAFVADDDGVAAILQRSPPLAPLATQRVSPHSPFATGYVRLNLQHSRLPNAAVGGQAWVMRLEAREGRYATEEVAASFDSSCTGAPFDHVSPGPGGPL